MQKYDKSFNGTIYIQTTFFVALNINSNTDSLWSLDFKKKKKCNFSNDRCKLIISRTMKQKKKLSKSSKTIQRFVIFPIFHRVAVDYANWKNRKAEIESFH